MKKRIFRTEEDGKQLKYIMDGNSSAVSSIIEKEKYGFKCYAAIMRCGHASNLSKYVPILFSLHARNKEEALAMALHLPRVKSSDNKGQSHCISIFEITWAESMIIKMINDNDPFLHAQKKSDFPEELLRERELILPEKIKYTKNGTVFEESGQFIKFSYQYPQELVLQRFLAPQKIGGQIINEPNLPPKQILFHQYFGHMLKNLPFNDENLESFCSYYKLFGHIRPQIFSLWVYGKKLYISRDGVIESAIIPDKVLENWVRHRKEFEIYADKGNPNDTYSMTKEISDEEYQEAMEERRVATRAKFEKIKRPSKNPKEAQPGDEE